MQIRGSTDLEVACLPGSFDINQNDKMEGVPNGMKEGEGSSHLYLAMVLRTKSLYQIEVKYNFLVVFPVGHLVLCSHEEIL